MSSKEKDTHAFTIRPSIPTAERLETRARTNHRSRSAEAVHLIEWAMDEQVKRLQKEQDRVTAASERSSPS